MAEIEADVIIVGSGISGALLAARLSQTGDATLLECSDQGAGMPLSAKP
jgi:glycine/D-amino acid oxidase-like deaminating enzyme